jgi:hypothetical protein
MQFKKNHLYVIEFLDHAIGEAVKEKPLKCQVSGWVINQNEDHVVLTSWLVISDDDELVKNNYEHVSILKGVILDAYLIV